jgi:hypothetical protein
VGLTRPAPGTWDYRAVPTEHWGKVTYLLRGGGGHHRSSAYIDLRTLEGENKYTDERVQLIWDDDLDCYVEIEYKEKTDGNQSGDGPSGAA